MKNTKICISGGFHNRGEIRIRAKMNDRGELSLSNDQAQRIAAHMCPCNGCECGPEHGWEVSGCEKWELTQAMQDARAKSEGYI